jgi:hypothetical protein
MAGRVRRPPQENEEAADRLVPTDGFAEERGADDDCEQRGEGGDAARGRCWGVGDDVEVRDVRGGGAEDSECRGAARCRA